jgi:hypothetical protein
MSACIAPFVARKGRLVALLFAGMAPGSKLRVPTLRCTAPILLHSLKYMRLLIRQVAVAVLISPAGLLAQSAIASAPASTPLHLLLDASRLKVGVDSFAILVQGKERGWQRLSRERDGTGWRLHDAVTIGAMVRQESVIRLGQDLRELELRQEGVMGNKPMRISLDFLAKGSGTRVVGSADTPTNPSGTLAIDTVVTLGAVDDNAVTPLLAAVSWSEGREIAFPVIASGKGTLSIYRVRVVGADTVTVPAGHFGTWRIELTAESTSVVMHVSRAAPFRIVRMQPKGAPFDIQLVK